MPDDVDARSTDGKDPHSETHASDIPGDELADNARIWRVYDRVAREEDRERIGNWNRGLDNLALFAGLFSAVTTAFIIEAHQDTEPDYARLTFLVLNASASGVVFKDEPFVVDPSVRVVYSLWIASLMLSLTAALIVIMGKDWIGMYAARPVCNPRQWAEIRTYRLACVDRWYMSGVIASAPVLLHISLLLFAAGLVLFVAPDPLSQRVALGFSFAASGLYLIAVLSAVVVPASPFKSPATEAIRDALTSLFTLLYDCLIYPPKRRPIALLQQATLIIGAAVAHPSPEDLLPSDRSQRRRPRSGGLRSLSNQLFSHGPFGHSQSWVDIPIVFARTLWAHIVALPDLASGHVRSTIDAFHYRRQRPRKKPWHVSARLYLKQIDLSGRWAEVRNQPTPELLAQALSRLGAATHSVDVLKAIISALGDMYIGRDVAPLVSRQLVLRVISHAKNNASNPDLISQAHNVLAVRNISGETMVMPWLLYLSARQGTAPRSETIVFALLDPNLNITSEQIHRCFPTIMSHRRALHCLFPTMRDLDVILLLAGRFWTPAFYAPSYLTGVLRSALERQYGNEVAVHLTRGLGGRSGLVEFLISMLTFTRSDAAAMLNSPLLGPIGTQYACDLIMRALSEESLSGVREHPCLVFVFGHTSSAICDAAWASLSRGTPDTRRVHSNLHRALPLYQPVRRRGAVDIRPPGSNSGPTFDICLARTVVGLLMHSTPKYSSYHPEPVDDSELTSVLSTHEFCVKTLHAHLCHPLGLLDSLQRLEIIAIILERSVLPSVCTLSATRANFVYQFTTKRDSINIVTVIARQLATLLGSGDIEDYANGARLFCLFSHSATTLPDGEPIHWDMREFLADASDRPPEQDPGTDISLRRLIKVLHSLRPLCAPDDDLRAAWEHIQLEPADEYQDSFRDAEDFVLGPLVSLLDEYSTEDASPEQRTMQFAPPEEFDALQWLDTTMR